MFRAVGGLLHRRGDLVQRRRGLLQACGLLLGATRQIIGSRRYFVGAGLDRARAGDYRLYGLLQLVDGFVEVSLDLRILRGEVVVETNPEIAAGESLEAFAEPAHRSE